VSRALVKICGLTREQDVDAAVAAGADLLGFVCVADSPRAVTIERARELAARAPDGVETVVVLVGAQPTPVEGFDLAQIYGVTAEFERTIVAVRGEPPRDVPAGVPVLLDLARGSRPDDEALRAHWQRAAAVRAPVVLAGSLDPGNVGEAIRAVRPWAVDTARGVESAPGVKDHELIRRFVRAAREAESG
jgi:phosphoribosylanthranilate isomerase